MVFMSNAVKLAGVKTPNKLTKENTQPTIDSQVPRVRNDLVQAQKILSVEMLTSELFFSKLEMSCLLCCQLLYCSFISLFNMVPV